MSQTEHVFRKKHFFVGIAQEGLLECIYIFYISQLK